MDLDEPHQAYPLSRSLLLPTTTRSLPRNHHGLHTSTILPAKLQSSQDSIQESSSQMSLSGLTLAPNTRDELESHFIALGHTAFLRAQRNTLQRHLADEKLSSARYRALSFRLAARVAARETKIGKQEKMIAQRLLADYLAGRKSSDMLERLRTTIRAYEKQGTGLLRMLSTIGLDGAEDRSSMHVSIPSPPRSPRASTPQTASENSQYLPTEILNICHYRVDALLRECRLSRDTLALLRETEKGLQNEVDEHQRIIDELHKQKSASDGKLRELENNLSKTLAHAQQNKDRISSLETQRRTLEDAISQRDLEKSKLVEEKDDLDTKFESLKSDLNLTKQHLHDSQTKADLLQKSKASIEEMVKMHKTKGHESQSSMRQSQSDLAAAKEQLIKLECDCNAQSAIIDDMKQKMTIKQRDLDEQVQKAQDLESASRERVEELYKEVQNAKDACVKVEEELKQEHEKKLELRQIEKNLHETVSQQKQSLSELEESQQAALTDLEHTKAIHATFVESSGKLSEELEGEKAKTIALIETEGELKSQISEYENVVSRLQTRIQNLEEQLITSKSESDESSDSAKALQAQLDDTAQVLDDVKKAHSERLAEMVQSQNGLAEDLQSAKGEVAGLKLAVEKSQKESASLANEIKNLQLSFDRERQLARDKQAEYENTLAEHRTSLSDREAQIQERDRLVSDRDAQVVKLTQQKEGLSHKNDYLQTQLNDLNDQKARLDGQLYHMTMQLARNSALKKDQDLALQTTRAKLAQLKTSRRHISSQWRASEHEVRKFDCRISMLENEIAEAKSGLAEAERREQSLRDTIENVQRESDEYKKSCVEKENEIEHLISQHSAQMNQLQNQLDTYKAQQGSGAALDESKDEHIRELQSQLDTYKAKQGSDAALVEAKDEHIQELQDQHQKTFEEMEQQVLHWRSEHDTQIARVKSKESLVKSMQGKHQSEVEQLNSSIRNWRDNHNSKAAMVETKEARIVDLEKAVRGRIAEIETLESTLSTQSEDAERLQKDLEHHKKRHNRLSQVLSEEQSQASDLRVQLEDQTNRVNGLNTEIRTLKRTSGIQVSKISDLEDKVHELENQTAVLEDRSTDLDSKNVSLMKKSITLEESIRSRDMATSHFHRQFRTLQKQATEATRRAENVEQLLSQRDKSIEKLHQKTAEHVQHIRELEAQLNGQRQQRHPLQPQRRYTSMTMPATEFLSISPPSTPASPKPTPSMLLLNSSEHNSPSSPSVRPRQPSYNSRRPSSPGDSIGYPSVLHSSPETPSLSVHEDSMTPFTDFMEGSPSSSHSQAHERPTTTGAAPVNMGRSQSMKSFLLHGRPKTPMSLSSYRHSSLLTKLPAANEASTEHVENSSLHRQPAGPQSARSGSTASLGLSERAALESTPETTEALDFAGAGGSGDASAATVAELRRRRRWPERHPRLWRLMHLGKGEKRRVEKQAL